MVIVAQSSYAQQYSGMSTSCTCAATQVRNKARRTPVNSSGCFWLHAYSSKNVQQALHNTAALFQQRHTCRSLHIAAVLNHMTEQRDK